MEHAATTSSPAANSAAFDFDHPVLEWSPKSERRLGRLHFGVNMAGFAVLTIALIHYVGSDPLVAFVWVMGTLIASVVMHELGHLVAARVVGATVLNAQLSWVLLSPKRSGWRFRWRRPAPGTEGHVLAIPPLGPGQSRRMAVIVAGGPLATAGVAAIGAGLCMSLDVRRSPYRWQE